MTISGKVALIIDALLVRVGTIDTGSPALPISLPEVAFDPPEDGKYLIAAVFLNRPAAQGLRSAKVDQGLLQVSVVWPKDQGLIAPAQVVQAVIDHFPNGQSLVSGGQKVKISGQAWAASPISDADRMTIPITIPWAA